MLGEVLVWPIAALVLYLWASALLPLFWDLAADWCFGIVDDATKWFWLTLGDLDDDGYIDVKYLCPEPDHAA